MSDTEKQNKREEEPLKDKNVKTEEPQNESFLTKLKYIKSNITVEPILAGLIIPSMLSKLAIQNLNLDKACRVKLDFGDDICDAMINRKGNSSYEAEVQKVISAIESWKSIIQTALPTILVIFMGAWSDKTGNRKICILLPIFAEFMVCISNILSTYFFKQISVEVTMFFEAFIPAIAGGWVMVYLGVFSYISDITDEKSRTFRVGLVNLCMTAGVPIGSALSGILLKLWGYYGIFSISGTLYLITFTYGFFYLSNNTKPKTDSTDEVKPITCVDMVNLVKETGEVAVKKREGNLRMKIILTLLVVTIVYGPNHAERIIKYLYLRYKLEWDALKFSYYSTYRVIIHGLAEGIVKYMFVRYRLHWDALKYSIYSTYSVITHSLGALFSISIFAKRWGFHDSMLCLISVTSKLAGSILLAFVQTDLHIYMVPIVEILNATTFTSLRSMASKLVSSEEMGKMNSLFSLVETIAALVFDPTYSTIYSHTITVFSGTVFLFSAAMTLPAISLLIWHFVQHRRDLAEKRRLQAKEMPLDEKAKVEKLQEN